MEVNPKYLEMAFDKAGIRNSQKRLNGLISELAVEPLKKYQDELTGEFELVESIVMKRVATAFAYWCQHKHDPIIPNIHNMMSDITNSRKNDVKVEVFYIDQVIDAMYTLAPTFALEMPDNYVIDAEELEYALLELEEKFVADGMEVVRPKEEVIIEEEDYTNWYEDTDYEEFTEDDLSALEDVIVEEKPITARVEMTEAPKSIELRQERELAETSRSEINLNVLNMNAQEAWRLVYNLMGYQSNYIKEKMMPRWLQYPNAFEQDRRYLYQLFIQAIQNAEGIQMVAGNFLFSDRQMTVDQLWNHYFTDLSKQVGPHLLEAKMEATANQTWWNKLFESTLKDIKNISPIWLLALSIALVFDGLTTYVSLDQTPMDGMMVAMFTLLITALFQIADLLVINYRKREFEADALSAKYSAKFEQLSKLLAQLDAASDSFVQFSMERSRAHADWKAAEDSRKMARRGRFWSARIADINIVVTAYGFAFMFLNAEEPMSALYKQIELVFINGMWDQFDLWVFLMIGLAITVSFVINTAQRTEILGWSMRRLKQDA